MLRIGGLRGAIPSHRTALTISANYHSPQVEKSDRQQQSERKPEFLNQRRKKDDCSGGEDYAIKYVVPRIDQNQQQGSKRTYNKNHQKRPERSPSIRICESKGMDHLLYRKQSNICSRRRYGKKQNAPNT
jgi:hypothetical protein